MCWTYVAHRRHLQGNLSHDLICEVKSSTESTDLWAFTSRGNKD